MELSSFDNKNKWVEVGDGFKVKLDYLTIEQKYELDSINMRIYAVGKAIEENQGNAIELNSEAHKLFMDSVYKTVLFSVKDWQGLERNGIPIKCELENNQLTGDSKDIIYNIEGFAIAIHNAIKSSESPVRFNDTDKKK